MDTKEKFVKVIRFMADDFPGEDAPATRYEDFSEMWMATVIAMRADYLDDFKLSLRQLMVECGFGGFKKDKCADILAAIKRLTQRKSPLDLFRIKTMKSLDSIKPSESLDLKCELSNRKEKKKWVAVTQDEYAAILKLAQNSKRDPIMLFSLLLTVKMFGETYYDSNGKYHVGSFVSKDKLKEKMGVCAKTIDSILQDLIDSGVAGHLSGKPWKISNMYCFPPSEEVLQEVKQHQIEWCKKNGIMIKTNDRPQTPRTKKFGSPV